MLTSKSFSRTVFLGLALCLGVTGVASGTQVAGGVTDTGQCENTPPESVKWR